MTISGVSASFYSTSYVAANAKKNDAGKEEETEGLLSKVASDEDVREASSGEEASKAKPEETLPKVAVDEKPIADDEEEVLSAADETDETESPTAALDSLKAIMDVANENTASAASLVLTNDSQLVELKKATIEEQMLFGNHNRKPTHRLGDRVGGMGLFSSVAKPSASYAANAYKTAASNTLANLNEDYQDDSAARVELSSWSA